MAIKAIPSFKNSHYFLKKAYREVSLLRQLKQMGGDKHVVEIKDVVVEGDCLFIVMEYIPLTLDMFLLSQKESFGEEEAVKLIYNLLCC